MSDFIEQMRFYDSHHRNKITKLTHFIGVPLIVLSLMVLLSGWHVPFIHFLSLAWVAVAALLVYYINLDRYLGLVSALFLLPMTILAQTLSNGKLDMRSWGLFFLLFVAGWAAQFIGHHFEGKRPAFLENVFQVFVAPIFLVAELCFALGYRKELQNKIREKQ